MQFPDAQTATLAGPRPTRARRAEREYRPFPLPRRPGLTEEEYRRERERVLVDHCMIAKLYYPKVTQVVGLATASGLRGEERPEDLLYYDASNWTPEEEEYARRCQAETGWFTQLERSVGRCSRKPRSGDCSQAPGS
jgi:hypothetical protein